MDKKLDKNLGKTLNKELLLLLSDDKLCNLCLSEKLCIIKAHSSNLLNKRDEMISKCRHENKFYIKNYKNEVTWDQYQWQRRQTVQEELDTF